MTYRSATIRDTIERINRVYFLPAIQRPFVWEVEQITKLFDSLMRGYPISAFMFWDVKQENWSNWEIYRFIDNFTYGSTHNELAQPRGEEMALVLDGQQRLTSLLIGLTGTYTTRMKYKRKSNPMAFMKQRLYLNLLRDESSTDDDERIDTIYEFRFFENRPANDAARCWFRVGNVLEFDSEDTFDAFKERFIDRLPFEMTRGDERQIRRTLDRLYRTIWKDEIIAFYTERDQNYDRVLDIFIRANDGGTKLSKSDLLLSMITSKWNGKNAREEIYNFVGFINNDMPRRNEFDKDFVLRSCLIVSELDCAYKVENFTLKNLRIIEEKWSHIQSAITRSIRLINRFGLDRDTLTSMNALMPIIYYFSRIKSDLMGTTEFEIVNAERVRVWLAAALLGNAFGGSVNATLALARKLVRDALDQTPDFPSRSLALGLKLRGRVIEFDDTAIDDLLDIVYTHKTCYLALSLLYNQAALASGELHIDHIVPKSLFDAKKIRERGLSDEFGAMCRSLVDRVGNLQLIPARENIEKSDLEFHQWIDSRNDTFIKTHLIPVDNSVWTIERFPEFVKEREKLIRTHLANLLRYPSDANSTH